MKLGSNKLRNEAWLTLLSKNLRVGELLEIGFLGVYVAGGRKLLLMLLMNPIISIQFASA